MRPKLLLLLMCAPVFFLGFLFSPARRATPAKTQPGNSFVFNSAAQASNASSPTQSISTSSQQNILKDFQQWVEIYVAAKPPQKTRLFAEGLSLAAERRRVFVELIESNPAEALRLAVPMHLRGQLPAEIVGLLEERVSGRGEYNVLATLPVSGAEKTVRPIDLFARLAGQTYQAFVYGRRVSQTSCTNLPLHGVAIDGKLAVHEDPVRPLEPGET